MSGFSADWLALREEADARARNAALVARLATWLAGRAPVRILDLGAGTGAGLRALAPRIGVPQHWVLADSETGLLARAAPTGGATLERRVVDLAADLDGLFEPVPDLVTASALFDLCGAAWIEALVDRAAACGAAVYAGLTYDGRERWAPPHPLDGLLLAAFHADQRRDKGLGPALGPEAHRALAGAFLGRGYNVAEAASDWHLRRPGDSALIAALAEGIAGAVTARVGSERTRQWGESRQRATEVLIGHRDLLALPPA